MTVRELIAKLEEMSPEEEVLIDSTAFLRASAVYATRGNLVGNVRRSRFDGLNFWSLDHVRAESVPIYVVIS